MLTRLDIPDSEPDGAVRWGSDIAAELLRQGTACIHTRRERAALVRSFVRWDAQPPPPGPLVESRPRAWLLPFSPLLGPVYVSRDAGLQEAKTEREPDWPDLSRFQPP